MRERFTDKEWTTLLLTPLFVNAQTAKIDDGVIDSHEAMALGKAILANYLNNQDELTREVCEELSFDFEAAVDRMEEAVNRDIADIIVGAGLLADRVSPPGSPAPYKLFILEVGEATADTSDPPVAPNIFETGHQKPYKDKGRHKKQAALKELRYLLGLPV